MRTITVPEVGDVLRVWLPVGPNSRTPVVVTVTDVDLRTMQFHGTAQDDGSVLVLDVHHIICSETVRASVNTVTCGCCSNGCCCHNHMDIPRGLKPHKCPLHGGA